MKKFRPGLIALMLLAWPVVCFAAPESPLPAGPCSTSALLQTHLESHERTQPALSPRLRLSGVASELDETLPEEKLTDLSRQAIAWAPAWVRDGLTDNLSLLEATTQDTYAQLILSPSDPRYTDEIAFCVASVAPEILQASYFHPELLEENAHYIYEHDQYLDYVRLVDVGEPGVDDDYYTTTFYRVEEGGVTSEYELDRDTYYWFIVHPKIEDETVAYCDPNTAYGPPADPPVGAFWRDWIFTFTEEIPDSGGSFYPVLRDQFAGVDTLVKWSSVWDNTAVGKINQWIIDVLDFTSGDERPNQPVRIYRLHVGRCGEHQDITSAAARACLIPCVNTQAMSEDHVWNELWERRWVHWEPVNWYLDAPLVYENGWGKKFSGVIDVYGDGRIWDVIERYSEGSCTIDALVEDANHEPIDGAKVLYKQWGYPGTWGFSGSDGIVHVLFGDEVICRASVVTPLGDYPESGNLTIANPTEAGQNYTWTATLSATLPQIRASAASPATTDTGYRLDVTYAVNGEVLWGHYNYDTGHSFSQRVSGGTVDFFIVDQDNWNSYEAGFGFEAHELAWRSAGGSVEFEIPQAGTWTAVITAERKLKCKQLVDVQARLEQLVDGEWQEVDATAQSLQLFPGERYAVSTTIAVDLGVTLSMPAHQFAPGDPCGLTARLGNPGEALTDVPLFVCLDVAGAYYFWPLWAPPPAVTWGKVALPQGYTELEIIPSFTWPAGTGSASGLCFYAGMTNAEMTEVLGAVASWEFGWEE